MPSVILAPLCKRKQRSQAFFDEYRRFSDAYDCTFRQWLDIRKTQWYADVKAGRHIPTWYSGEEPR